MVSQYVVTTNSIQLFKSVCSKQVFEDFDDTKIALALADEKNIIGIIIAKNLGNKMMIQWLYIKEEFRGQHLGSRLVMSLLEAASRAGVISVGTVATTVPVMEFLFSNYFVCTGNHRGYMETSIANLNELPAVDNESKSKVMPISNVLQKELNSFCNDLINKSDVSIGVELPIKAGEYSDLSMAYVVDNTINAIVLLKEQDNGIEISYVYMKPNMIKPLLAVLNVVFDKLKERYSADTALTFGILNRQSDNLARKLFKKVKFSSLYEFERKLG